MTKTNSIIEVNGSRYDALTGQIVSARKRLKASSQTSSKKVIDGFSLGAHHARVKLKKSALSTRTPAQDLHQRQQRAKTLMRSGLPQVATKTESKNSSTHVRAEKVHPIRELRAKTVSRHAAVNRFGHFAPKPATSVKGTVTVKAKVTPRATKSEVEPPPAPPSMLSSVSHKKLEKMLDEALVRADAHKQMFNDSQRQRGVAGFIRLPRWVSLGLIVFVLAVTAAFLVWQNLPAVAVHVAAAKAHVNASIPAYKPDGFDLAGPLEYAQGVVSMNFEDKNQPSEHFTLTQQASSWNSESLQANALPKQTNVQSSEVKGTTVYIYGTTNDATWVNNNVMYKLTNKANLTSDQVLRIVQSL